MALLWVDKQRPKTLQELDYHNEITSVLKQLATKDNFPHLLFYGPNGAGKKTRVMTFLNEVYGPGVHKLKSEQKIIKSDTTSTSVEVYVLSSNHHIDLTPADYDNQDSLVINKIIKETASTQNLDITAKSAVQKDFKVIIINEADRLSKNAQAALRRTMEKYMSSCRLILICEQLNKLIMPIRSRCLNIRIPAPNQSEIKTVLEHVCTKEQVDVRISDLEDISRNSQGNLRAAILQLQIFKKTANNKNSSSNLKPQWKKDIANIVNQVKSDQSLVKLQTLRDRFYNLLVNGIEGQTILRVFVSEVIEKEGFSELVKMSTVHHAAEVEIGMNMGSKPIYHLESFVGRVMLSIREDRQRPRA